MGSTFVDSILVNELEDQVNQLDLAQEEAVELKNQAVVERDLELQNNQALRTQIVALENDHLAKLAELQEANDQRAASSHKPNRARERKHKIAVEFGRNLSAEGSAFRNVLGSLGTYCGRALGYR